MFEQFADVAAVPSHPLTEHRGLGLSVRASVERDHSIARRDERVHGQRPSRRRSGVAMDEDDRVPLAFLDIAEIHPVTRAKRRQETS
jgi:hypothetical protein